jgi:hypothetical protein
MHMPIKLFIIAELFQIVSIVIIYILADQTVKDSYNGMQALGPMLLLGLIVVLFMIYLLVSMKLKRANSFKSVKYFNRLAITVLAFIFLFDLLLIFDTYNAINESVI